MFVSSMETFSRTQEEKQHLLRDSNSTSVVIHCVEYVNDYAYIWLCLHNVFRRSDIKLSWRTGSRLAKECYYEYAANGWRNRHFLFKFEIVKESLIWSKINLWFNYPAQDQCISYITLRYCKASCPLVTAGFSLCLSLFLLSSVYSGRFSGEISG